MWIKDFSRIESRLLLLIMQFILLLLSIGYIEYVYTANISPDRQVNSFFQKTECFLISKKLSVKGHFSKHYRAEFLISYRVNGTQYNRWVSGNGLDYSFNSDSAEQTDLLAQYALGSRYPCWYNPDDSETVVLVHRHDWLAVYPLMVPAVLGILVVYFLVKNLLQLTGVLHARSKKRKK